MKKIWKTDILGETMKTQANVDEQFKLGIDTLATSVMLSEGASVSYMELLKILRDKNILTEEEYERLMKPINVVMKELKNKFSHVLKEVYGMEVDKSE